MVEFDDGPGFAGKVAMVVGGGASDDGIGNGRAAAILLARAGAKVMVVDRLLPAAERTVAMIADEGGDASAHAADITQEVDCQAMVAECNWLSLSFRSSSNGVCMKVKTLRCVYRMK